MATKKEMIDLIKASVGTEFTYIFDDGAEIPAVIAAFDPNIGFTCLATSLIDSKGEDNSYNLDKNGNLCLLSCKLGKSVANNHARLEIIKEAVEEIITTGKRSNKTSIGVPHCHF